MKPAPFDYVQAQSLEEAARLLLEGGAEARPLAGGQSLGPMLNLRLAQPRLLVDLMRIAELGAVDSREDAVVIGATVSHAAIEDRRVADVGRDVLSSIATRIAYRAVRNRGTIGGSVCHADPAADWVSAFVALGASVITYRAGDRGRVIPIADFIVGAFLTVLEPGEIMRAIAIPRLSAGARWGWCKICRKPGEFASAIGAVLDDPGRGIRRAVVGATGGRPVVLEDARASSDGLEAALSNQLSSLDAVERRIHRVALRRALAGVSS